MPSPTVRLLSLFSLIAGGRRSLHGCVLLFVLLHCGGCPAQQPWPLWQAYVKRYIDAQGRVIDHSDHERSTSEGQAYAMFFALVDNDKGQFGRLLSWTETNLAGGDLTARLPAWRWGQAASGEWKTLDENSASDADLWMAYTLVEAGRLWHDPRYAKLGRLMAERIAREEVVVIPGFGTALAPGPRGFQTGPDAYILNPSYLPATILARLAKVFPDGPWAAMLEALPRLLSVRSTHGYALDWVAVSPAGVQPAGSPAESAAGAQPSSPSGSYDAIRVYLWLGLADPETAGRRAMLAQVSGLATYLRTAMLPPREVSAEGTVVQPDGPVGFSAAAVPYLAALGMKTQARLQADRLLAARDSASGLSSNPSRYYDENLALFSTAWSEKRYRLEASGELHVNWK